MGKRVEIHGTSSAALDGKLGVATDFHWYEDWSQWRYTVHLDNGEALKIKPADVRAQGAGVTNDTCERGQAGGGGNGAQGSS